MAASPNPTPSGGIQALRPANTQSVNYDGTAGVITNAITGRVVRVLCTSAAFIAIGSAPTATSSDMPIGANSAEYFRVRPGEKVSAIQQSASGTLYVTEMD